jgi:hypothetical protein
MNEERQKNQLVLAFAEVSRDEALRDAVEGTNPLEPRADQKTRLSMNN